MTEKENKAEVMKILVVDDNPINIDVLEELLDDRYDVMSATSGEEALELAKRHEPDLILLDIMMPGRDGYQTCREIREHPKLGKVKIILVSGKGTTSERLEGYAAGADDYITKPYDCAELDAKVEVFLRLKSVEEVDRLKGELLDLVAHEIRTPLTGIMPAAELLMGEGPMSEDERRMWGDMIHENGRRLMSLAEKGLLLCQFRAGEVSLSLDVVDIAELVEGVVCERAECTVDVELSVPETAKAKAASRLEIHGDSIHLRSAIRSVLRACIDLTDTEGVVRVEARGSERGIEVSFSSPSHGLVNAVEDRIFHEFSARSRDEVVVGARLGMALARAILIAHGGGILAHRDGGEAMFTLWLPVRCDADRLG